jgi:pimeloyl-ACP methyl ester carboxylesterase
MKKTSIHAHPNSHLLPCHTPFFSAFSPSSFIATAFILDLNQLGEGFTVVCPDLPGHGSHLTKGADGRGGRKAFEHSDFGAKAMAVDFLSRFRVECLGQTRGHHVVGFGFGACVAME